MESRKNVGARLKEARQKLGLTIKGFAVGAGLRDYKIRDCENGRQRIDDDMLRFLGYSYGINLNWLVSGEGGMFSDHRAVAQNSGSVILRYYPNVTASGGYGTINENTESRPLAIDRSLLSELGVTYKSEDGLDLIRVLGDSMEPFAHNGEFIMVARVSEARNNEVVIANIRGDIYIKRLLRDPMGKWISLISDNSMYDPIRLVGEEIDELHIIGVVLTSMRPISAIFCETERSLLSSD
jgi:transcriptional regulator with XRE-family HTH domain